MKRRRWAVFIHGGLLWWSLAHGGSERGLRAYCLHKWCSGSLKFWLEAQRDLGVSIRRVSIVAFPKARRKGKR